GGTEKEGAWRYAKEAEGEGFGAVLEVFIDQSGYKPVDGGAYADGTTDYTAMLTKFKLNRCQYFSNCALPPDFNIFWKQAHQQGWRPRLATVAKVLLFPDDTAPLGPLVNNIATNSWWGPYMPNRSSLDPGLTAIELAHAFQPPT